MNYCLDLTEITETYLGHCHTSMMELFVKLINSFYSFNIVAKNSIIVVWQGSNYVFGQNPTNTDLLKTKNEKNRTTCEIYSQLTVRTRAVFIINFKQIWQLALVFLLLTLNEKIVAETLLNSDFETSVMVSSANRNLSKSIHHTKLSSTSASYFDLRNSR